MKAIRALVPLPVTMWDLTCCKWDLIFLHQYPLHGEVSGGIGSAIDEDHETHGKRPLKKDTPEVEKEIRVNTTFFYLTTVS
ncbi:hypothetical protein JIR001_25380 [Polycladomyces abyssicola]|uniref:Uncharacterized protein n=1 Tax=Polycladomyces abyssicola TaxID=1125966 RepID=A0A8D5ZNI1_9BACL|nr:hypothetical protein JIR001_25380 [Polycladomyces abyssicola]